MEKIEVKRDKLFSVTIHERWNDKPVTKVMSLANIEHSLRYFYSTKTLTINCELSDTLPKFELFLMGHCSGRCYSRQDYRLISDRELTEDHFNMLRQFRAFMTGQRHGEVVKHYEVDGKHFYELVSELDSSD